MTGKVFPSRQALFSANYADKSYGGFVSQNRYHTARRLDLRRAFDSKVQAKSRTSGTPNTQPFDSFTTT
jgi:hypothetical protein